MNPTVPLASAAGEADLDSWVGAYASELRRHLTRMLGNAADAEDLLQQVWITALENPPESGQGSNVRAWLYRVATNRALDCLSAVRRRRKALSRRGPRVATGEDTPVDTMAFALSERARQTVRAHCAGLPRKQREAVWMRWVDGLDYASIAERLNSSPDSARANVYQGMKRLRTELEDLWTKEFGA